MDFKEFPAPVLKKIIRIFNLHDKIVDYSKMKKNQLVDAIRNHLYIDDKYVIKEHNATPFEEKLDTFEKTPLNAEFEKKKVEVENIMKALEKAKDQLQNKLVPKVIKAKESRAARGLDPNHPIFSDIEYLAIMIPKSIEAIIAKNKKLEGKRINKAFINSPNYNSFLLALKDGERYVREFEKLTKDLASFKK